MDRKDIIVKRAATLKEKPDQSNLGFGKYFTDHMFVMDYTEGKGWHDPMIVPYEKISLDPSAMIFHYGQAIFEGLKAYRTADGKIYLFRPKKNMQRVNISNDRLCIPPIDVDFAVDALCELIKVEQDWIPTEPGTSLYIRPFIIATDCALGVHPSRTYKFMIILSPVGAYYKEGLNPVKIYVEDQFVRAVRGGIGFAKTPGNYAASLKAQMEAEKKGYTQVLWLDGVERKYIEEVGTMNIFFKINGEIVTPALQGSILGGITRMSCIELLRSWGYAVNERPLALAEVEKAARDGVLEEVFGTGTAAVISPVGELKVDDEKIIINKGEIGPVAHRLYDTLTGIQNCRIPDPFGWVVPVE